MTQQSHCWAYTLRKPKSKETRVPPMFIAALFIVVRTWKQPRCPSADEWIRKLWYIYMMEYYSAIKKNAFEIKTTMRFHLMLVGMAAIQRSTNNKYWRGCREKGTLLHHWWECKLVQPLWRTV